MIIHTDCMGDLLLGREVKHGGPGVHATTGTPQAVHGSGGVIPFRVLQSAFLATQMLRQRRIEVFGEDADPLAAWVEQVPETGYSSYRPDPAMTVQRWIAGTAGGRVDPFEAARGLPDAPPEKRRRFVEAVEAFDAARPDATSFAPSREEVRALTPAAIEVFEAAVDIRGGVDPDAVVPGAPWAPEPFDTSRMDEIAERYPEARFNTRYAALRASWVSEQWSEHAEMLRGQVDDQYAWPLIDTPEALEFKRALAEAIGDPEKSAVAMRVPWEALEKIIEDGRFKNQHESGASSAYYAPTKRRRVENEVFGLPARGMRTKERPVYGYVADKRDPVRPKAISLDQYGSVAIVFKDEVRARTTTTFGDSLDDTGAMAYPAVKGGKDGESKAKAMGPFPGATEAQVAEWQSMITSAALPIDAVDESTIDITAAATTWRGVMRPEHIEAWRSGESGPLSAVRFKYVEAQLHGGVTLDDIASVHIPGEDGPAGVLDALRERGIPVHSYDPHRRTE